MQKTPSLWDVCNNAPNSRLFECDPPGPIPTHWQRILTDTYQKTIPDMGMVFYVNKINRLESKSTKPISQGGLIIIIFCLFTNKCFFLNFHYLYMPVDGSNSLIRLDLLDYFETIHCSLNDWEICAQSLPYNVHVYMGHIMDQNIVLVIWLSCCYHYGMKTVGDQVFFHPVVCYGSSWRKTLTIGLAHLAPGRHVTMMTSVI